MLNNYSHHLVEQLSDTEDLYRFVGVMYLKLEKTVLKHWYNFLNSNLIHFLSKLYLLPLIIYQLILLSVCGAYCNSSYLPVLTSNSAQWTNEEKCLKNA